MSKQIKVTDEVHTRLGEEADRLHFSISRYIEYLMDNQLSVEKVESADRIESPLSPEELEALEERYDSGEIKLVNPMVNAWLNDVAFTDLVLYRKLYDGRVVYCTCERGVFTVAFKEDRWV